MKIATSLPSPAGVYVSQNQTHSAPKEPQKETRQPSQETSLALVVQPRTRGIHPFLAVALGDKGCAASASVTLQSDSDTESVLDDFSAASKDVNRNNICAGLSAEWLLMNQHGDAQWRMEQLDYGSQGQERGAQRQQFYKDSLAAALAEHDQAPFLTASRAMLKNAGLRCRGKPTTVLASGGSSQLARSVAADVAQDGRKHLLSLRFASIQGHAVACACEGNQFKLFDPNLGEYQCPRSAAAQLLKLLLDHYNDLNCNVGGINEFRVS